MQSEILPSELQFVAPSTVPQARSYMFRQQSENTDYTISRGEKIRINIPRLQRSYLMKDSYIRFRVNVDIAAANATSLLWLDRCGAYGLFERIEVYDYLGGTLLEQTNNIPALYTLLGDLQHSMTDFNGKMQSTQGYEGSNVQTNTSDANAFEIRTANSGMTIVSSGQTSGNDLFTTVEFCLPVLSFLGTLSDKYIPLHNGFSVDFFLNNTNNAFVSRSTNSSDTPFTINQAWITNFEYCCQVMELGEIAESMVMATNPFVIHCKQYRHFSDSILGAGTQSTFRMDLNLNVVSLRNIRFQMRPALYNDLRFPTYGHRIRNFLQNWNLQYGSSYLPEISGITCRASQIPISKSGYTNFPTPTLQSSADWHKASGFTQCYNELVKTVSASKQIPINWSEYRIDTAATTADDYMGDMTALVPCTVKGVENRSICGKFAAGIDTRLSHKNAISGIDTNGLLVCINGQFDRDRVNDMQQAILDVWAEYDAFINIIPGIATTTTF